VVGRRWPKSRPHLSGKLVMRRVAIKESDTERSGYCPDWSGLLYSGHSSPNSWSCEWFNIGVESLEATSSRCILTRFLVRRLNKAR
jgi:hypothetical protein